MKSKKILFIVGTHGNEEYAIPVVERLQEEFGFFDYVIGNPKAVKINKRFTSSDLNRIYPGKKDGDYEERRAYKISRKMQSYDYVIDIHGVPGEDHQPFIILCNKVNKKDSFDVAGLFPIQKTVIWESTTQNELGASVTYFHGGGFEIEFGLKDEIKAQKDLKDVLRSFLKNIQLENPERFAKEIFKVTGRIPCEELTELDPDTIKDFTEITVNKKTYIPILPRAYMRMGNNTLFVNVVKLSDEELKEYKENY